MDVAAVRFLAILLFLAIILGLALGQMITDAVQQGEMLDRLDAICRTVECEPQADQ